MKRGDRIEVRKMGKTIQWVHAFKVNQVVVMGNVSLSPVMIGYLLTEGIDTVFMSVHGKYRGRLISQFGKNIELRRAQFRKMDDAEFRLDTAKRILAGKLANSRTLLRRLNQRTGLEPVIEKLHRIRLLSGRIEEMESIEALMGVEGRAAVEYFQGLGQLISGDGFIFEGRNRRPPRDPVNALLSLGYTLLANAVQTQVNVVGLDPYLGCLHAVDYGRPSLALDLMEEFRPVLVDSLVMHMINRKEIRLTDFYYPEEKEPAAYDFAEAETPKEGYPVLLTHQGMRKFITRFERKLNGRVMYVPTGKRLTYRDVCLEQVRLCARCIQGNGEYVPYPMK